MDIDNNNQEIRHQKQGRIFRAITKYLALAWLVYALLAITVGWTYYRTSFIPPLMFALVLWRPKPASYVFMMSAIIAFIGEQLFYILTVFSPMRIFALLTLYVPYHLGIALILGIVAYLLRRFKHVFLSEGVLPSRPTKMWLIAAAVLLVFLPLLERTFDPSWAPRKLDEQIMLHQGAASPVQLKGKYVLKAVSYMLHDAHCVQPRWQGGGSRRITRPQNHCMEPGKRQNHKDNRGWHGTRPGTRL